MADGFRRIFDDVANGKETSVQAHSRRVWLQNFAAISASGAVLWACGSNDDKATGTADCTTLSVDDKKADVALLNTALGLEYEAISIYTQAAGVAAVWTAAANALAPTFLEIAKVFLTHHQSHAATLKGAIESMQADTSVAPAAADTDANYIAHYPGIGGLTGAAGLLVVLQAAAEREMNAANVYASVIATFKSRDLAAVSGGHSADEAAHYGVLNAACFVLDAAGSKLDQKSIVGGSKPAFTLPAGVSPRK